MPPDEGSRVWTYRNRRRPWSEKLKGGECLLDINLVSALDEGVEILKKSNRRDPPAEIKAFAARVSALRSRLGLTQEQFASRYGIALGRLRNWEQARGQRPDKVTFMLIAMIERDPDGVAEVAASCLEVL